jgi:hypothetical protein
MWDLETIRKMNSDEEFTKSKKIALAMNEGKVIDVQDNGNLQGKDGDSGRSGHDGRSRVDAGRVQHGVRTGVDPYDYEKFLEDSSDDYPKYESD